MSDTKKLIAAAVVVIVLLIGMAISSKTDRSFFPKPGLQASPTPSISPVSSTDIVIENYTYNPANLVVKVGQTITWENKDTVAHTATADDGSWDTGTIEPGEKGTITFDTPGTYSYYCIPHPEMKGTIVVE